jgi:hypothetical protein
MHSNNACHCVSILILRVDYRAGAPGMNTAEASKFIYIGMVSRGMLQYMINYNYLLL